MATISSLTRWHEQPDLTVNGQSIETEEAWVLQLNTRASNIAARKLLGSLSAGNIYNFPIMGETAHPDDSQMIAINYTISRDTDGGFKYIISITYTNNTSAISESKNADNANEGYDYQEATVMEEIDIDPIEEKAIEASTGEAYWPKLQRPRTMDRIIVTRNEGDYAPAKVKRFRNKVNNSSTRIDGNPYEARSLLMQSITGKRQTDQDGNVFYNVRYVLLYDPDKLHKTTLMDVANGPDINGTHPQIKGGQWNKPWKLDGQGAYASKADQQNSSYYKTNTFNKYPEVDINVLRL